MAERLTGGCYCGAVRYEVEGVLFDQTLRHCAICGRPTGTPERAASRDQTWTSSRIGWMALLATLPAFDASRIDA